MCGIAGIHIKPEQRGKLPVGQMLDELLLGIEHRGRDATGFINMNFDRGLQIDKAAIPASKFIRKRKKIIGNAQSVLGHTRLATQGPKEKNENNHPVQFNTTFVTHNGVIYNDAELFRKFDWQRPAEVDTVAIAAMLHEIGFDQAEGALEELEGSFAIAAVDVEQPGKLLLARGSGSPLFMFESKHLILWASTREAIKKMWGRCFGTPPADSRIVNIPEGRCFLYDNGELVRTVEFKPKTFSYYGAGWSTFTGSRTVPFGFGRGLWDDDLDDDEETTYERRGYWIKNNDGTQTWKEFSTPAKKVKEDDLEHHLDVVRTYQEWVEVDAPLHLQAISAAAAEARLETDLALWLMFFSDWELVKNDESLNAVYKHLQDLYAEHYDRLLLKYGDRDNPKGTDRPDTPPFPIGGKELSCIECGKDLDDEDSVMRCGACLAERALENVKGTSLAVVPASAGGE